MRTIYYPEFDTLEHIERPDPQVKDGEVLLEVRACAICGSELETYKTRSVRRTPPLIMGHEFCGIRTDTGEPVVCNAVVPCGRCPTCARGDTHLCPSRQVFGMHRAGAFAEWVAVPERALTPWPEELPAEAACLAEPLANGVHGVGLTAAWRPKTVLIFGAGPIGLMAQQAFQAMTGARTIVCDRLPERLAVASANGAERVLVADKDDPVSAARDMSQGLGVDVVIDAVGAGITKRQALEALRPGGAAVWLGLHEDEMQLNSYAITLTEKAVFGTYSARLDELATALELMRSGQVDVTSWPQIFSLADGVEAFHRMLAARGSDIKAILIP